MQQKNLKIIDDTYEFILWAIPKANSFPRSHRFLLGQEIISGLYQILKQLINARYSPHKKDLLKKINIDLETQRYFFRLAFDFKLLNIKAYEFAMTKLNEIGSEIGGWIKSR